MTGREGWLAPATVECDERKRGQATLPYLSINVELYF
jgi:hypothetical protein